MHKSSIFVTGANGQLGNALKAMSIDYLGFDFVFAEKENLDITDKSSIAHFFSQYNFNYCINAAAYTKVDLAEKEASLCYNINEKATRNLAEICLEYNTTLIHISSDYVYHPDHSRIMDEDSITSPQGTYAKSKLAGEATISIILRRYIIIRTSWVYYKSGHNFVKTMLSLGQTNAKLKIVGDQIGSPTYALDLAHACLEIITLLNKNEQSDKYGIYNFSNSGFTSWAEFAKEIFRIKGLQTIVEEIPTSDYPTPAKRPLNSKMSKAKINASFQIVLKPWKKALFESLQDNK